MANYQTLQLRCGEAVLLEDGSLKIYGQHGRFVGMEADDMSKLASWLPPLQPSQEENKQLKVQAEKEQKGQCEPLEEAGAVPTLLLLDWFEFGRLLYEQDDGMGKSFRAHGVEWKQLTPGIQQIWANRAERSVRAFIEQLSSDIQQRLQAMMLEKEQG